jgi:signal transduction histidine kinase
VRRIFFYIVAGVVLPMLVTGAYVALSSAHAAEKLLRRQMDSALLYTDSVIAHRWTNRRSDLQLLAGNDPITRWIASGAKGDVPNYLRDALASMDVLYDVIIQDSEMHTVATLGPTPAPAPYTLISAPITDSLRHVIGFVRARVSWGTLVPQDRIGPRGTYIGLRDLRRGGAMVSSSVPFAALSTDRFRWSGEDWIVVRRPASGLDAELFDATALSPVIGPFRVVARNGLLALLLTTAAVMIVIYQLTRHLARREALSALGELAATIAHQIRTPLTSLKLDLQLAEEEIRDAHARGHVANALAQVRRLDDTLRASLRIARGQQSGDECDLRSIATSAADLVRKQAAAKGVSVSVDVEAGISMRGDAKALEQLFINLITNAVDAARGHVAILVSGKDLLIEDDGPGFDYRRSDEPFFTTKENGSGLGLQIARQVARAHHAHLTFGPRHGGGTVARLRVR